MFTNGFATTVKAVIDHLRTVLWLLQRWLERTPGLSDRYFNFWQKYKAAVKRWLNDEFLQPALVC